jgi:hypothetical protein
MDAQELAQIEDAMAEEHRRDREALERLKRFLHHGRNGNTPRASAAPVLTIKNAGETKAVVKESSTILSKVAAVMTADASRSWNGPQLVEKLASDGNTTSSKRPVAIITRALRQLVKRGTIRRVKKGTGTTPHAYRAVEQSQNAAAD